ncbi:keratin-associated protein 19-2-like, partial [Anopheles cruzii]|uniref:keratin-associated protein 19-2-like n=1 Tax=Anopheles cruzii TaxID=68878 RepID=UPI0022EC8B22
VAAGVVDPRPSSNPAAPRPIERIVKREAVEPAEMKESTVEDKDDMDKAETFGFGYHKVIHVYPSSYYPGYNYPGYYPGYNYGYGNPYGYSGYGGGYGGYGGYYY